MSWLFAILIAIGLGFGFLWADQIRWISEGFAPKQKRIYNLVLWSIYAGLMLGAMTIGVVLNV